MVANSLPRCGDNQQIADACRMIDPRYTHVLEFGVHHGGTLRSIKGALEGRQVEIFGFDSFEGLPEDWVDTSGSVVDGMVKGHFSMNGNVPVIENVVLFKGWFEDTLPVYLQAGKPIALLHVDCDLYSSTKTVLHGLNHLIMPGTMIVFDEWIYFYNPENNDHEQKAFYEWARDNDREFELIPTMGRSGEQQIVRIIR
jgi:hypothetical protein